MNAITNEPCVQCPNPLRHGSNMDRTKYYSYHKDVGHTTEQCTKLKDEIEFFIRKGCLKEYVYGNQIEEKKSRNQPSSSHANDKWLLSGVIHTIV